MNAEFRKEIVDVCFLIINNDVDFIEGCRKLVSLRNQLDLEDEVDFLPFVGVASETDEYPVQGTRENYSEAYLKRIDEEISNYVSQVRPSIIEACNVLIVKYS